MARKPLCKVTMADIDRARRAAEKTGLVMYGFATRNSLVACVYTTSAERAIELVEREGVKVTRAVRMYQESPLMSQMSAKRYGMKRDGVRDYRPIVKAAIKSARAGQLRGSKGGR